MNEYQEKAIKSMAVKDGMGGGNHYCQSCGEKCSYPEDKDFKESNNRDTAELMEKGNMKQGNRFEER